MKKCPFCAEDIQDAAIKCRHCGEFLEAPKHPRFTGEHLPWYFGKTFIIIALASVGPLALPLIWWHPTLTRPWKIGLTLGIMLLSVILYRASMESIQVIQEYYKLLNGLAE